MWQIVKNELSYHKFILIFGCITVALFGNATKFGFERFDLSEMAWMVFLGAYTVIYTKSQEEKETSILRGCHCLSNPSGSRASPFSTSFSLGCWCSIPRTI